MSFSLGSVLISFLQPYCFNEEMSTECLLLNRHGLDTEYSNGSGQGGGLQWVQEGLTRGSSLWQGCSLKGSPLSPNSQCVCVLPSCQLLPRGTNPGAAFPGKMFMF